MSGIDFVLLGVIALALGGAFGLWNRSRKAGKTCGGDCSHCSGCCGR